MALAAIADHLPEALGIIALVTFVLLLLVFSSLLVPIKAIVLNLLSTEVMIALGRVHRGLMVDMQARNAKLRLRAVRMLRTLTGREDAALEAALAEAGGRVKTAVLVLEGLDRAHAEALLAEHGGKLRAALASLGA